MTIYAHPPELLARAVEVSEPLCGGVTAFFGFDPDLAHLVGERTGSPMDRAGSTLAYVNEERDMLALVFHYADDDEAGTTWLELSILHSGMRLRRHMLANVASFAFHVIGVQHLIVRARPTDARLIASLLRLGFTHRGEVGGRALLALSATDLPQRWRHWRDKHVH